jgi:phosphoglycerate-specific signal transduction histidine kinase
MGTEPKFQPTNYVQQYKFIRLDARANYEPLILALKGLQLSINPGDYLTPKQLASSPRLQDEYEELKSWAANPAAIPLQSLQKFLSTIRDGLMQEGHHKPYHKRHYIEWAIGAVETQIQLFNQQLEKHH